MKDYNKLRPYDLDTAKVGDRVLVSLFASGQVALVTTTQVVFHWDDDRISLFTKDETHIIKLAPLAWHKDGTPIYKGDSLWVVDKELSSYGKEYVAERVENGILLFTNGVDAVLIKDTIKYPHWDHTKPMRTIRIGEFDVPEPVREPLAIDQIYWVVYPLEIDTVNNYTWQNGTLDNLWLKRGLIHLTQEAAALHAKALLSFTTTEGEQK